MIVAMKHLDLICLAADGEATRACIRGSAKAVAAETASMHKINPSLLIK